MTHDTIITAAMIEAERLRMLAESYEASAAYHETEATECERQERHARAAYHRQSAEQARVLALRWREEARQVESEAR